MRFPFRVLRGLEDAQSNFEFLEGSNLFWGVGAPTFTPDNKAVSYYFRRDTPTVANQRIYIFTGSAWTGIV